MPSWAVPVVTVVVFFVGFGAGYWWRGWKERVDTAEDIGKR